MKRSSEPVRNRSVRERSAAPATIAGLEQAGVDYEAIDELSYRVAGRFMLFTDTTFWRSEDGKQRGYGVHNLVKAVAAAAEQVPVRGKVNARA